MKNRKTLLSCIFTTILLLFSQSFADIPTVRLYVFSSPDCPGCEIIEPASLARLSGETGCRIEPKYFDIDDIANYRKLVEIEKRYGHSGSNMPVVFIGSYVLDGVEQIEKELKKAVKEYVGKGGVDWPDETETTWEKITEPETEEAGIEPETETTETVTKTPVYLAFFYETGCRECDRVFYLLNYLEQEYPFLIIKRFDLRDRENKVLFEAVAERISLPERQRLVPATLFAGSDYLQQKDIVLGKIEELLEKHKDGSAVVWDVPEEEMEAARERMAGRFSSFGLATVSFAGLIDGFNPCAFAVLVFFISYLTVMKKTGRDILFVGLSFISGIFITYFLIGLGILSVLFRFTHYALFTRILNGITGAGCIVLGVLSFTDFLKAKRGNMKDITLQLSKGMKDRIHSIIIKKTRLPHYVAGSFAAGIIVSVLEFACTGQVYLPTIVYITGNPGLKLRGTIYLLIYNLFFILPLFIILAFTWMGTTMQRLTEFSKKNVAVVKLLLSLFFFSLGSFLLLV
jgi:cytochrome c biogenesis protein CcdA